MKDPVDNVTQELVPLAKKRGRPPTGSAKTPAQRKADQRNRVRTGLTDAFSDPDKIALLPTSTLCEGLSVYVSSGWPALAAPILAELARRACEAEQPRETQYITKLSVSLEYTKRDSHE